MEFEKKYEELEKEFKKYITKIKGRSKEDKMEWDYIGPQEYYEKFSRFLVKKLLEKNDK
jgi:hypothetical protein